MVLLLLFSGVLLTACKTTGTLVPEVEVKSNVDKQFYTCKDWPKKKRYSTQRDVARVLVRGKSAWKDCRNKLHTAGRIQESVDREITRLHDAR